MSDAVKEWMNKSQQKTQLVSNCKHPKDKILIPKQLDVGHVPTTSIYVPSYAPNYFEIKFLRISI